jgi:hypothetical protein
MKFYLQKIFFLCFLVLFINDCKGVGKDIGINGMKVVAEVMQNCVGQLTVACKSLEATLNNLGVKSEKLGCAFADGASNAGIKSANVFCKTAEITAESAQILAGAVKKVTYVAWGGVVTAASYIGYKLGFGIYDRYKERNKEKALCVAKQALMNVLLKNSANKQGLFGFPEGCEKEVGALMILPGGNNELTVIRETFMRRCNK